MRIGIDIKAFKNGTTGIARYLRSIMDELQKLDRDNEYFLFEPRPLDYEPTNPKWRKVLVASRLPGTLWLQFVLPIHLRKHRIDVFWAAEQVCPLLMKGAGRIVTSIYDLAYLHFPESYVWSNLLIQKKTAPRVMRKSDVIVTISDFVRREILRNYGQYCSASKVVAIPCGAPDWKLPADYDRAQRKDFLFFAGNLEPRKNLINLIKALEILHERGLDIPLHLAGPPGWKNKALFGEIERSPVRGNIRLLGFLSEEQLKAEYLTCRALVYPSLYEGFGLPVLEALTLDCPVLTSKGTVMEEIAGKCALYFDPLKPEQIAEKIDILHADDSIASRYEKEEENSVSDFAWNLTARRLAGVLLGQDFSADEMCLL